MIGVDIVDFSSSFRSGKYSLDQYKSKILLKDEFKYCTNWNQLDLLWAIKESAYKCHFKQTGYPFNNPKKIHIIFLDPCHLVFKAVVNEQIFTGRYTLGDDHVKAVCTSDDSFATRTCDYIYNKSSLHVQEMPVFELSAQQMTPVSGFVREVSVEGKCYPYSRSHHGRYYFSAISL